MMGDHALENVEVADLLRQFLSKIQVELPVVMQGDEDGAETVVCVVQIANVRYTLVSQRCSTEEPPRVYLSPREKEVVRLVMKGLSTRGVASILDISPWTVSTHLRRIFAKLGVSSRAEMVACVLKTNGIDDNH